MKEWKRSAVTKLSIIDAHTGKHRFKGVAAREFYALTYRYTGKIVIEAEGVRVVSVPGSVTFTPAGMDYRTAVLEDTHFIALHFYLEEPLPVNAPAVLEVVSPSLASLFSQLKERSRPSVTLDFECMSLFYRLLSELETISNVTAHPTSVQGVKEMIDNRFSDAELSVQELSRLAGVSDSYLRRAFSKSLGCSPSQYLSAVRIRHAKVLLQSEYLSISEIAEKCGYHSTNYFIQAFRAHTGSSPGAYRKSI